MTTAEQSSKIQNAITLDREITRLTEQLEGIKAEFRAQAERDLAECGTRNAERGLDGQSYTFQAEDGAVCTVSFPEPGLTRQILFLKDVAHRYVKDPKNPRESILQPVGCDVKKLCGDHFKALWMPFFKPAKAFKELVPALVRPESRALHLLECVREEPGTARVAFKAKKTV